MDVWGSAFVKACRPRPNKTGSEWADSRRYVAPGTSPEPGEWRTSRVPYTKEMMDVATDRTTEITVMMCSSQVAKSEILMNSAFYYVDWEPSPILWMFPTDKVAEAFSKERIAPTFKYSEGLRDKLDSGEKKSGDTILNKSFPGGYLAIIGSNSPSDASSRPIRIFIADEIDRTGITKEGDSLKLGIQRTTNFHNRKIIFASTPTIMGQSKVYEWFLKSDQRYFHIPCLHCGVFQKLTWSQVKWDKTEEGEHLPETARYECKHCNGVIRGAGKISSDLLAQGYWKKTKPKSKIAGFHINSLYSPWVQLSNLVEEFTTAMKSRNKQGLMEFINLKLGEPWEEEHEDLDYEHLHSKRREYYKAELPDEALLLTAGVDVQDSYLASEIVAWGRDKESWGIEYRIFMGDPGQHQIWNQLDEYLQKQWSFANGQTLGIACTCIDSGGHFTTEVYQFTKRVELRRIFAIRGVGGQGKPFIGKPVRNNRIGAIRFDLGVDSGKMTLLSRLRIDSEGPGYCHFPRDADRGYDLEYFRGLLSEKQVVKYTNGQTKVEWKEIYERNEPLDVRNYATAAMEILNPDFEFLANHSLRGNVYMQKRKRRKKGVLSRGVT